MHLWTKEAPDIKLQHLHWYSNIWDRTTRNPILQSGITCNKKEKTQDTSVLSNPSMFAASFFSCFNHYLHLQHKILWFSWWKGGAFWRYCMHAVASNKNSNDHGGCEPMGHWYNPTRQRRLQANHPTATQYLHWYISSITSQEAMCPDLTKKWTVFQCH